MDLITLIMACSVYTDNAIVNAMIQLNSSNAPLMVSGTPYKTPAEALDVAKNLKEEGRPFAIGLMQIPSFWLEDKPVSLSELLRPCKNVVLATQILNDAAVQCNGETACALSTFKTGNAKDGIDYANQIIQYAADHPFVPPPPTQ
jgi:soluble lytic murein transglycosylase-like protein